MVALITLHGRRGIRIAGTVSRAHRVACRVVGASASRDRENGTDRHQPMLWIAAADRLLFGLG